LKIIGTAGTKEGMALVKEQGADYVYNHKENDYMEKVKHDHPEGIDIILEMLANVNLNNDLQILKAKKGRVVVIGNRGTIDINPRLLMAKETSVTGVTLFSSTEEEFEMMNSHLQALIKNNCIKPVIGKVFTLEETPEAQSEVINNAGTFGRITIKVV
jgi:NADPH2:quinone reductase